VVEQALARDQPYSVAFVDMRMPPGWDGVQTIKRLWELDPELQCVICTAYSDYSWEEILDELGVGDRLLLLRKPFDAAEVCQLACALTEKWHLARRAHLKLEQLRGMVNEQTAHLAESEARYALAAAGANDGLWDWDLVSNVIFLAPRWSALLGLPADEPRLVEPGFWFDLVHPDEVDAARATFERLRTGEEETLAVEYRIRHADGQYRWMLCRGAMRRLASGQPVRAAGSQSDITDRKVAEAQLRHDAMHDPLTGLPNRARLCERLENALHRYHRNPGARYAVLFIDLDRFKVINDSLGHVVGDRLLIALSERLTSCLRRTDTLTYTASRVARLGGDEFVVLLEGVREDVDAVRVTERLLEAVAEPFDVCGHSIHTSLSVGIAIGKAEYERVEDVLRDADTALYRAKADGRGRYRLFTEELHVAAMARWRSESDLRRALGAGEFTLHYQPVVSLATGQVEHFEALVRWRHPERGLLSPAEFLPIAEETGLILQIGTWVLEESCRQIRAWAERGVQAAIAVNVGSKQFAQADFVDTVRGILESARIPARALRIEVTEDATMHAQSMETCARLAELGLGIHLDDFGTGYSSLGYLTRMPVHALKVDRSFVARMEEDPISMSIVKTILTLATALRIEAVAEGVETASQADLLRRMGCACAQGFFWSKPVDADRAFALAARELSGSWSAMSIAARSA
jgi:diguanylate cyclase (GGDEF)-like protein/PAS domain S-box-containing protein